MKLYLDNDNLITPNFKSYSLYLEMEIGRWKIVDKIEDADVIPIPEHDQTNYDYLKSVYKPNQILLILELYHASEYMGGNRFQLVIDRYKEITDKVVYVHHNLKNSKNTDIVYFDVLFNRQKLYCTEYDRGIDLGQRCWTNHCNKKIYEIDPNIEKHQDCKKFLSVSNITENSYDYRMTRRRLLKSLLEEYYSKDGFINDPLNDKIFVPNSIDGIFGHLTRETMGGIWYPVNDYYYKKSIVSIYVETLVQWNTLQSVTEKTFDPLIKGNFVLPYGHYNLISILKNHYGFRFPDWIDYSYDDIQNDDHRFIAFIESVKKLMKYSRKELYDLYLKDIDILKHNRKIFYTRPYDNLYNKVTNCINHHGWKL